MRAAILVLLFWSIPRLATAHPDLQRAQRLMGKGDFRGSLQHLKHAEASPALTDDERAELYWREGVCFHVMGQPDDASRAFDLLLEMRPLHQPDEEETPPDILVKFGQRARRHHELHGVELGLPSFDGAQLSIPLLRNAQLVRRMKAYARVRGERAYAAVPLRLETGAARGALDVAGLGPRLAQVAFLEVAVEAYGDGDALLARSGDGAHPLVLAVSAAQLADEQAQRGDASPPPVTGAAAPAATAGGASLPTLGSRVTFGLTALSGLVTLLPVLLGALSAAVFGGALAALAFAPRAEVQPWRPAALLAYQGLGWVALGTLPLGLVLTAVTAALAVTATALRLMG